MGRGKKVITFILTAIALALLMFFYANDTVTDWIMSATSGSGTTDYYDLAAAQDGSVWALGRNDDAYVVTCGTLGSGREWKGKLNADALPENFLPKDIFAISEDQALLTGYRMNTEGSASNLQIYVIGNRGKELTALMDKEIKAGVSPQETMQLSTFAQYNDKVFFLLWDSDTCYLYELSLTDMMLRMTGSFVCDAWRSALILNDGKIAVTSDKGILSIYSNFGVHQYDLKISGSISKLYAGKDGFYFLDSVAQTVNKVGEADGEYYIIQEIPADSSVPMAVQPGGSVLWLENAKLYHYDGAPVEVEGLLYRAKREGIALLTLCAIGILILSGLVTVVLCGKYHISLLIRVLLAMLAAVLLALGAMKTYLLPELRQTSLEQAQQCVETAANLGLQFSQKTGEDVPIENITDLVCHSMEGNGFYDTRVTLYRYTTGGYYVIATNDPGLESDTVVAGNNLLLKVKSSGTVSALEENISGPICAAVSTNGTHLLFVQTNFSSVWKYGEEQAQKINAYLIAALLVFACIVFFMMARIWGGINRLMAGMNLVSAGEYNVELYNPSGDELESLANSMNNMAVALRARSEKGKQIDANYMRFIPEETIRLMGVDRLEDVTRETVANHKMAVMTVRFYLPGENIPTEQLFSDINMIIQRTIFAAVAYGGNSFNFTHDGYNVVFPEEFMEMSFHAALAIKEAADAVNKERELALRAPVRLCIAMDFGLVQMGIVGDELHMVPSAVSLCLEKNEQMLRICKELDAGILFTETMASCADDCNFRYVGNFVSGNGVERLYELYEGDSYLVAQRKKDTQEEFEQAIGQFYQKNFAAAKGMLLQLARTGSSRDGSVCYYLNKADLYEQYPPKTPLLHGGEN